VTGTRLLFVALTMLFVLPAYLLYRHAPRTALFIALSIAVLHTPIFRFLGDDYASVQQMMAGLVGAMVIGGVLLPFLNGKQIFIVKSWRRSSNGARLIASALLILLSIATINTLLLGAPAAGTAISFLIWPIAISELVESKSDSSMRVLVSPNLLLKWSAVSGVVLSIVGGALGELGQFDTLIGVLSLGLFGTALTGKFDLPKRVGMFAVVLLSWAALVILSPDTQSVLVGILLGALWMLFLRLLHATDLNRLRHVLVIITIISILIGPVITILAFTGNRDFSLAADITQVAVAQFGETELNLLNRPARWEALMQAILREPFRLEFTNFLDTEYYQPIGFVTLREAAQPHNIVIAIGRYIGIPGMVFFLLAILGLIGMGIATVARATNSVHYGSALSAFGVVVALLFRNMWSLKLFVEPVEIVFFSLAVLVLLATSDSLPNPLAKALPKNYFSV